MVICFLNFSFIFLFTYDFSIFCHVLDFSKFCLVKNWKNSVISPIFQLRQTIYHSKELDELSRMKPKLRSGLEYRPSYGFKKVKKEKGGVSSFLRKNNTFKYNKNVKYIKLYLY